MFIPIGDDNSDRRIRPFINVALIGLNLLVFFFLQGMVNNLLFTFNGTSGNSHRKRYRHRGKHRPRSEQRAALSPPWAWKNADIRLSDTVDVHVHAWWSYASSGQYALPIYLRRQH